MARTRRAKQTEFDRRVAKARAFCGLSEKQWSLKAGYSEGYIKQARHQAAREEDFRLSEDGAEQLAKAIGISAVWLRDGRGEMASPPALPTLPNSTLLDDAASSPSEAALIEAYGRDPSIATPEDVIAARKLVYDAPHLAADNREALVMRMGRFLRAVAKLRRDEEPVTMAAVMWELTSADSPRQRAAVVARDVELNAEALAELRALGAEPPREPVKTPPRGTPARMPKAVEKRG